MPAVSNADTAGVSSSNDRPQGPFAEGLMRFGPHGVNFL
jgi:hypothetical protein